MLQHCGRQTPFHCFLPPMWRPSRNSETAGAETSAVASPSSTGAKPRGTTRRICPARPHRMRRVFVRNGWARPPGSGISNCGSTNSSLKGIDMEEGSFLMRTADLEDSAAVVSGERNSDPMKSQGNGHAPLEGPAHRWWTLCRIMRYPIGVHHALSVTPGRGWPAHTRLTVPWIGAV